MQRSCAYRPLAWRPPMVRREGRGNPDPREGRRRGPAGFEHHRSTDRRGLRVARPGPERSVASLPPGSRCASWRKRSSLRDGRAVLRLPGGVRWVAQHEAYDPPHQFVDRLVSLPLPWRHRHEFEAVSPSSTRLTDVVETPVPGSLLDEMFRYRHRQLAGDLAAHRTLPGPAARPVDRGGHRLVRAHRLRAVRVLEHGRAPGHQAGAADGPASPTRRTWDPEAPDPTVRSTDVDARGAPGRRIDRRRFTDRTRRWSDGAGSSRRGGSPRPWPAMATGPGSWSPPRPSGSTAPTAATNCSPRTAHPVSGFLAELVGGLGGGNGSPRPKPGCGSSRCATASSSRRRVGRSDSSARSSPPVWADPLGGGAQWVPWIGIDDVLDILAGAWSIPSWRDR